MLHHTTHESARPGLAAGALAACLLLACHTGCTSALTTSYLRAGLWDGSEHASEEASVAEDRTDPADAAADTSDAGAVPAMDPERREAALEESMARLARLGPIDPAVEAALVATLQRTQPEDWPVVVEEFAASLTTAAVAPEATPPPAPTTVTAARPAEVPPATPEPTPSTTAATEQADHAAEPQAEATSTPPVDPPVPETAPPPPADEPAAQLAAEPPLAVRSACFASAVRAWGDVDRFAADRFRPGQEVIVYVELDNLAAGTSPAGHTTCIDAALRLVDGAGRTLHQWTFDPLAETCPARRRDYFARYVVRIPDATPPGACRVEMAVTDTLAGATADASLPLEIAAE